MSIIASYENGELRMKLSFLVSRYYITQKTANWTNRIVIVQRKYVFDVETPHTLQFVY